MMSQFESMIRVTLMKYTRLYAIAVGWPRNQVERDVLDWQQDSEDGGKNEALFWRLHFNKEAAIEAEQLDPR